MQQCERCHHDKRYCTCPKPIAQGSGQSWGNCGNCKGRSPFIGKDGLCRACGDVRAAQAPNTKMGGAPFITRSQPRLPAAIWFEVHSGYVFEKARDCYGNVHSLKVLYATDLQEMGATTLDFNPGPSIKL